MISHQGELIRINTQKNSIEYSSNEGRGWHLRVKASSMMGTLQDLTDNGKEILVMTSKGLFYSKNQVKGWHKRG